jgi:hypothetical protein
VALKIVAAMRGVPWLVVENVVVAHKADIESKMRVTVERKKEIFRAVRKVVKENRVSK